MTSPGLPGYIRFFACTDSSDLGLAALEYGKALCRIAPVRVITMSATLTGPWMSYAELMGTPMEGVPLTAVCCDPSRWVWSLKVPAPDKDRSGHELVDVSSRTRETIQGFRELYTAGQRNILFAVTAPRDARQLEAAEKYDEVIVPSGDHIMWWTKVSPRKVRVVPTPVVAHDVLREAVCP